MSFLNLFSLILRKSIKKNFLNTAQLCSINIPLMYPKKPVKFYK
jgi:hypothetical protein